MNLNVAALIKRIRDHDNEAICQLVEGLEPRLRNELGARLAPFPGIRRLLDADDIMQSGWLRITRMLAVTKREWKDPDELFKVMRAIVHNCLTDHLRHVRREFSQRAEDVECKMGLETAAFDIDLEKRLEQHELLCKIHEELSEEEKQLAERWARRDSWKDLAASYGKSTGALRNKLARTLARVRKRISSEGKHAPSPAPDTRLEQDQMPRN